MVKSKSSHHNAQKIVRRIEMVFKSFSSNGVFLLFYSGLDSRLTKLFDHPFQLLGSKVVNTMDDEKLMCCAECTSNFEKEAKDTNCGSTQLPFWLHKVKITSSASAED